MGSWRDVLQVKFVFLSGNPNKISKMYLNLRDILVLFFMVVLLQGLVYPALCSVELKDDEKGIHPVVETCNSIGTFSLGARSGGYWNRLTYNYPKAWDGTFISVIVNDRIYANSENPSDINEESGGYMDPYVVEMPYIDKDSIITRWRLPERILVEEKLQLMENGTRIQVKLTNENTEAVVGGLRIHLDTMLGENDGAPIYIPGAGLRSTETEYFGNYLNFDYWKAYNRKDQPSIISTGILYGQGLSYPSKLVIANWKKSMYSSWDYKVDTANSILWDSAVLLYYKPVTIDALGSVTFTTIYKNGQPILPTSRGYFGIAEIVPDKVSKTYCPGDNLSIDVDVINRGDETEGSVKIEIEDNTGIIVHRDTKSTGRVDMGSVNTIGFTCRTPSDIKSSPCKVRVALYRDNKIEDRKEIKIYLDRNICPAVEEENGFSQILLPILSVFLFLLIIAGIIIFFYNYSKGRVEVYKIKEGDIAKVIVDNNTNKELKNCMIEDKLAQGAEVNIYTMDVLRKGDKLIWDIGTLKPKESVILEYKIRGVGVIPTAVFRWDSTYLESK